MKKFNIILHTLLISILIFTTTSLQSMENNPLAVDNSYSLAHLSDEILMQIFPLCLIDEDKRDFFYTDKESYYDNTRKSTLETDIKKFMQLRSMCTTFNRLLTSEVIGKFCKTYSKEYKKNMVRRLLKEITQYTDFLDPVRATNPNCRLVKNAERTKYHKEKIKSLLFPALIAAHADVYESPLIVHTSHFDSSLWKAALLIDDAEFLTILIKDCHLQPWYIIDTSKTPPCFYAKTIKTAQVIIDNQLYKYDYKKPNILWQVIHYGYPAEVLELYIQNKFDIEWLHPDSGDCLLHALVHLFYNDKEDTNFIKKVELLLTKMPDKINTVNKKDFTPLDVVQKDYNQRLESIMNNFCTSEAEKTKNSEALTLEFESLISLLKKYGCLTAEEIAYNATWAGKFQKKVSELYNIIQI